MKAELDKVINEFLSAGGEPEEAYLTLKKVAKKFKKRYGPVESQLYEFGAIEGGFQLWLGRYICEETVDERGLEHRKLLLNFDNDIRLTIKECGLLRQAVRQALRTEGASVTVGGVKVDISYSNVGWSISIDTRAGAGIAASCGTFLCKKAHLKRLVTLLAPDNLRKCIQEYRDAMVRFEEEFKVTDEKCIDAEFIYELEVD